MGLKGVVALSVLLAACRSAGTEPTQELLGGEWEWVGSSGGIAGRSVTPASEGYTVRFAFSGNQLNIFRNDSLRTTALFTVRGDEVTYQPSISVFGFDGGIDTQTLVDLPGDTIMLNDPCCDRFSHRFVRR
jgi:hypothetical protein